MWIKEFDPPFNVRYKDDKSYPFMAITLGRRGAARHRHAQSPHPGREVLRAVPEGLGRARHDRPDDQGLPDPHVQRRVVQEGDGHRPALLPRADRPLRRTVLDEGDDRGAPRDRRRLRRVHGRRRPAVRARAHGARMREASAAMDYESAAVYRDQLQAIDAVLEQAARSCSPRTRTPTSSASPRTSCRRRRAALRRPRRPRPRCAGDDDREGARHQRRRPRRPGAAARVRRRRRRRHPAAGARAGAARRRGGTRGVAARSPRASASRSRSPSGGARPSCCGPRPCNAQQALMLHKTRRTSDYVARTQALTDLQEALGTGRGAAAHRVLRRLAPGRHERRRLDGRVRGRAAAQGPVPLVRACPRRPTTPTRSTRCSRGAWPTSTGPTSEDEPDPEPTEEADRRRRRGSVPRFAYPPQLLVVDGGKPQVEAAARALARRRPRGDRPVRHREATRGGVAAGGGLPGHPAAHERGALPAAAAARRGAPLRDHAPALAAGATSSACSRRSPVSASDRIKALLRHFGSVSRAAGAATAEEIAELPGVGPKLAGTIHAASARLGRLNPGDEGGHDGR